MIAFLALGSLLFPFAHFNPAFAKSGQEEQRLIVVFKDGLSQEKQDEAIRLAGGKKLKNLDLINGRVVNANQAERARLSNSPGVARVDEDFLVEVLGKITKPVATLQPIPWGVSAVKAPAVWPRNTADAVNIGIIDTGISQSHPDLLGNIAGGANIITPGAYPADDNGHGTHVAGIIAALNDTQGVVGVAPKANLFAIKVMGPDGSGYMSDIINGLGWAVQSHMQVVNMSLGTDNDYLPFHEAVQQTVAAGVTIVAAAGNNSGAVIYPAAYPEVIAVSATDSRNRLASFSSRGPEVDLAAPGVSILSTYLNNGYAIMSGTSMASPHVAAAAALSIASKACDSDSDGTCTPLEVKEKLQKTATNLGTAGFDNLFGWGLVNADVASL